MIHLKPCLALVGIVFLLGAVLHEPKLPVTTSKSHFTAPELTYARMERPYPATNSGFLDGINLSLDPPIEIPAPDLNDASLNFQRDLPPGGFDSVRAGVSCWPRKHPVSGAPGLWSCIWSLCRQPASSLRGWRGAVALIICKAKSQYKSVLCRSRGDEA